MCSYLLAKAQTAFLYVLDPTRCILDLEAGAQTLAAAEMYNGQPVVAQRAEGRIRPQISTDETGGMRVLRVTMK